MIVNKNAIIPFELITIDLFGQIKTNIVSVKVRVFHRESGGTEVDDLVETDMSGSAGKYYYEWASDLDAGTYVVEYRITDEGSEEYYQREDLAVGYLEDDLTFIKDIESGKWEIVGNSMIFYKQDGISELMRFNLFDSAGKPSMTEVFKRIRV
jgi:hypothetical protein